MPQINQLLLVYQSQWFWQFLVLAVIYVGIGKGMLPKIEKTVDDRDAKIAGDLAAAEKARAAALEIEERAKAAQIEARTAAQAVAAEAKAKAAKDAENRLAKADAEIAAKAAESEKTIAGIRDGAAAAVAEVARDVAAELVGALGGGADAKTVTAAVTARLKG